MSREHPLPSNRRIRRAALQALYQLDAAGDAAREALLESLEGAAGSTREHEAGADLALAAWAGRATSDALVDELAPDWPTRRQPVVDRSLLRLALHELRGGATPGAIVISEAVELAKEFSTERSPAFVNGVLDRAWKRIQSGGAAPAPTPGD